MNATSTDDDADRSAPSSTTSLLLHREVRWGAILWIVGVVQFFVAMIVVQLAWTAPYSLAQNYISDLGNTACGPYGARYVCSPIYYVFNASIIALGILLILGTILVRSAFPSKFTSRAGLVLFALAGLGAAGVGLSPENVNNAVHSASAVLAFAGGTVAVLLFATAFGRRSRWGTGFWAYSVLLGATSLGGWGLVVLAAAHVGNLGATVGLGGIERIVGFPVMIWGLIFGFQLALARAPAPGAARRSIPS
ncbi:MAG: DUF998 domain-containing protein [Thermoplasmata archaeon]